MYAFCLFKLSSRFSYTATNSVKSRLTPLTSILHTQHGLSYHYRCRGMREQINLY